MADDAERWLREAVAAQSAEGKSAIPKFAFASEDLNHLRLFIFSYSPLRLMLAFRAGDSGQPWRGINIAATGQHWKFTRTGLDELDQAGRIYWPPGVMAFLRLNAWGTTEQKVTLRVPEH